MNTTTSIRLEQLKELTHNQYERLSYIDFRLYFLGRIGRQDLMERFGLASAAATRDFAMYRDFASENIDFDNLSKNYVISENFQPLFDHIPEVVMTALSQGFGAGVTSISGSLIKFEFPPVLNCINLDILSNITRAIFLKQVVKIKYFSGSSGETEREIVPFALATDGLRWHARAFDRKRKRFNDFVISRIDDAVIVIGGIRESHEFPEKDNQWNRIVELDLVPHPQRTSVDLVKRDFGMLDGVLHLQIRAAMVGYVLLQLHVDCSSHHTSKDESFRLWLKNPIALYGVESAKFAPGYKIENV